MLKKVGNKTYPCNEKVPPVRMHIVYLLLIGFINTIVFPTHSIVHHYVQSASLRCISPDNANLVEYIVEDYLDITPPASEAEDTDVHDMEISLEDVDFIHSSSSIFLNEPLQAEPVYFTFEDYRLFNSYLSRTTPPPEI
jgi:hypothetical protein